MCTYLRYTDTHIHTEHVTNDPYAEYAKNSNEWIRKWQIIQQKNKWKTYRNFTRDTQMANTYMKRCSMLLVTGEKKIKMNRDAITHAIRRTTIKKDNPRCWQSQQHLQLVYWARGSSHFGKLLASVSTKAQYTRSLRLSSTPQIHWTEMSTCVQFSPNVPEQSH